MTADRYPDSDVFYRALDRALPRVVRGEGCWLYDSTGKKYLDACGGAFAANIGHGVAEIGRAASEQMGKIAYVNGTAFTNEAVEALASELSAMSPIPGAKSYFLSSGSEAVEAALKLCRQYWTERGKPGKTKILARTPGYHGNTLLALSASARPHYKKLFGGWLVPVPMVPAPYAYRCACAGAADCPACSGDALEALILKEGAETIAAFIAEPVGGSSTGASMPRPGYYKRIREICDRHGVLFVADEVLCGAGRTGRWLGLDHYAGVVPDLITMGKGISGGYVPLSCVQAGPKILDALVPSGGLKHAQTFSHMPSITAIGLAAVRHIKAHKLVERAAAMGAVLQKKLSKLAELPSVGDVRGVGMLAGVEFVADKKTKKPFARSLKFAETLTLLAQEEGLVVWPNVGQADETNGDLVMIAPAFIITEAEIDELVSKLSAALKKTNDKLSVPGGSR